MNNNSVDFDILDFYKIPLYDQGNLKSELNFIDHHLEVIEAYPSNDYCEIFGMYENA